MSLGFTPLEKSWEAENSRGGNLHLRSVSGGGDEFKMVSPDCEMSGEPGWSSAPKRSSPGDQPTYCESRFATQG
jgi:hypothetical protein